MRAPSGHRASATAGPSYGIVTVANDAVYHWAAALLGSIRRTNPSLPVRVVPFDRSTGRLASLLDRLQIELHQPVDAIEATDAIATASRGNPGMFRRLLAFDGPFDLTLYLDADTVVLRPLEDLLDTAARSAFDVVFGGAKRPPRLDRPCHFEDGPLRDRYTMRGGRLWNAGIIFAKRGRFSTRDMALFAQGLGDLPRQFTRYCEDQAFICHYLMESGARAVALGDIAGTSRGHDWERLRRTSTGPVTRDGRPVPFLHWAGTPRPSLHMPRVSYWVPNRLWAGDWSGLSRTLSSNLRSWVRTRAAVSRRIRH